MTALNQNEFTHLILNTTQSDGNIMEIIPNIKRLYPTMNILVYSMQNLDIYIKPLQLFSINNLLHKTANEVEAKVILSDFMQNKPAKVQVQTIKDDNPFGSLSARELEVLHYLLKGYGSKEIATFLGLKLNTVSTHKKNIFTKINCRNLKELSQSALLFNINNY